MSNSPLVTYTNLTKNRTAPRNHKIDTITIHCYVGQVTAKEGCDYFATTERKASSNYVVGYDGSIGLSVEECNRSWCSSNDANDHRAITIETACDKTYPYAVTDAAYNALIDLCADICKRNNIPKLLWIGDKAFIGQIDKQNMTVHRWFAATECPGDWLYERMGKIAEAVNAKLTPMEEHDMVYYKTFDDIPVYYQDAIKKVIDAGALKGTSEGVLNVSEDLCRTLTILDRLGKI